MIESLALLLVVGFCGVTLAIFTNDPMKREEIGFATVCAVVVLALLVAGLAHGAPIPNFRPWINWTGFDPSPQPFTYTPITNLPNGQFNQLKDEYANLVAAYLDPVGSRYMDYQHINDNSLKKWSDRPTTTDYGVYGLRNETTINVANQMRAKIPDFKPWINTPGLADEDYARQLGRLWGTMYAGDTIYFAHANESWNPFGTNIAAQNMFLARAEFPGMSDFDALSRYQGRRLGKMSKAFKAGLADVAANKRVVVQVEGFAPITYYADLQLQQMQSDGVSLADTEVAIAQYAFGSATDPGSDPLGTNAQKRDAVNKFVDNANRVWTLSHRALAQAFGLRDVVNAYEFRLATKPVNGAEIADWVNFQLTNENAQSQDHGWRTLVEASGGPSAALNVEGLYGFPMDAPQGQFPLLALDQFNNPNASGAYRGTAGIIDFASVPEPVSVAVILLCGAAMLLARGRKVKSCS